MTQQNDEKKSLRNLIACVQGIPDRIQTQLKAGIAPSKILAGIGENIDKTTRQVNFYGEDMDQEIGQYFAHYTSWDNLLAILSQERPVIRMYNYETANDPLEGRILPKEWEEIRKKARCMREYVYRTEGRLRSINTDAYWPPSDTYGYSFSSGKEEVGDDLTFWRLYGNNGEGCSLMMKSRGQRMYRIRYRQRDGQGRDAEEKEEDGAVAAEIDELLDKGRWTVDNVDNDYKRPVGIAIANAVQAILEGYSYLVKDVAYSVEKEWRRVLVRPTLQETLFDLNESMVKRYVEGEAIEDLLISGSRITIGPTVANSKAARDYVEKTARMKNILLPVVETSGKAYR